MSISKKIKMKLKYFINRIKVDILNISELDLVIPGEISKDPFSDLIKNLSSLNSVKTIIEIGSSSGEGSTKSFVESIKNRKDVDEVTFFCLELSDPRFKKLQKYLKPYKFANAFNLSSVDIESFPGEKEVELFYKERKTALNKTKLSEVLRWRQQDIEYISSTGRNICGLEAIKLSKKINNFDLCLIDGSEFTGKAELNILIGANYILLDDTETFKCREAFEILDKSHDYQLIEHQPLIRNGFAAFKKIQSASK